MKLRLTLLALLALLMIPGCQRQSAPRKAASLSPASQPPVPAKPALANLPVMLNVRQRSTNTVPGSDGNLLMTIDDITRGQVIVSLSEENGAPVLAPRSMKPGEEAPFQFGEGPYVLKLVNLTNELVGDDTAEFMIHSAARVNEGTTPLSEAEKIEWLIQRIAGLDGAVFIRNGAEHTAAEAAEHLRMKWKAAGDQITTAEQFIENVASKSSLTGDPYEIQLPGGRRVPARKWLDEELAQIEAGKKPPAPR